MPAHTRNQGNKLASCYESLIPTVKLTHGSDISGTAYVSVYEQ